MHAPEYNQAADRGGSPRDHQHCGYRGVLQPALTAADIDAHEHRNAYIDAIIAATHRDAGANASTAYYLPDEHVYRDGDDDESDAASNGDDGKHPHSLNERADRPAADALRGASRAAHGPTER
jgi:hypothetical protein